MDLMPIAQVNQVDVVDSRVIADVLGIEHNALMKSIKKYKKEIEADFERLGFEILNVPVSIPNTDKQRIDKLTICHLTEDQALFIGTLSRNTEKVVSFKMKLVKSFQEARKKRMQTIALPTPKEMALLVIQAEDEKEKALEQLKLAEKTIQQQAVKVEYVDKVLNAENGYHATTIAADFGLSAVAFNKKLKEMGVQRKIDNCWTLTAQHAGKGYTKFRTIPYLNSKGEQMTAKEMVWTEKGRAFLHHLLDRRIAS